MSQDKPICGFCGRECQPEEDVGFLKFPDGTQKAAHLTHTGVKEEYQKQGKVV